MKTKTRMMRMIKHKYPLRQSSTSKLYRSVSLLLSSFLSLILTRLPDIYLQKTMSRLSRTASSKPLLLHIRPNNHLQSTYRRNPSSPISFPTSPSRLPTAAPTPTWTRQSHLCRLTRRNGEFVRDVKGIRLLFSERGVLGER